MGRDSSFLVFTSEDEDEAFERLAPRLSTRGTLDDDWCGWGLLVRLADVLRDDVSPRFRYGFGDVWLGYGRDIVYPTLFREMAALPWVDRERVQVLARDQDDAVYALWLLRGEVFVEAEHPGTERVPDGDDLWPPVLQVLPLPDPYEPGSDEDR